MNTPLNRDANWGPGEVLSAVGRIEGLRKVVKPSKSTMAMVDAFVPLIGLAEKPNGQDKIVLNSLLRTICKSSPEPVMAERRDLIALYIGADGHNAMALLMAVLVLVDKFTYRVGSTVDEQENDWYFAAERMLIANWWWHILNDMLRYRPQIVQEDQDEVLRRLEELDPVPASRLADIKTKSCSQPGHRSNGHQHQKQLRQPTSHGNSYSYGGARERLP